MLLAKSCRSTTMKTAIILLAIVGLMACSASAKKEHLERQKFLLEIVYRMEDPLMFEKYIKLGKTFTYNKDDYNLPEDRSDYMMKYYQAYKYGVTLPKGEFFGALVHTHFKQLLGLFDFLYYAKTWEIFQRNVCWARMHANEGMFVHALSLTIMHRKDFKDFSLPMIYEIFPQYFFNSKFIYAAEKFDYDVWSKYIMYEKEYKDFLYTNYTNHFRAYDNYSYFYAKDWKMWQWWKLMGLGEHWYSEDRFLVRDNIDVFNQDAKYLEMFKDVKMFWMPVDYTRDVQFYNKESALSYFTEDVEWNAFWYYFNLQYDPYLHGEYYILRNDARSEYYMYVIRQTLARYYMERLSHGYGEIPELSSFTEHGYDPQLINYNGVGFSYRRNYYEFETYGNFGYLHKVLNFFKRVKDIITLGYYITADGKKIDLRKPESSKYIGDMIHIYNVDNYDKYFATFWHIHAHMYLPEIDDSTMFVHPSVFLNFETMLRDQLIHIIYKKINEVFYYFYNFVNPYTHKELHFPGVTIADVTVSNLTTFDDFVDFDVTNLLNDKMTFIDGEFVWDKTLLARQSRLNHKDFKFEFTIRSNKDQKVLVRTFLGPKFDELGRVMSLNERRKHMMQIDEFDDELKLGNNTITRSSVDFLWTTPDRPTYTEMYKRIVFALESDDEYPPIVSHTHCGFPDRLVLPRGWAKGMPVQLFFFVSPITGSNETFVNDEYEYTCGIGSDFRRSYGKPFGYPFDREIDEFAFYVPNMYFKNTDIYHEDTLEKYYDYKYNKFGTFDYSKYYKY